MRGFTLIELLAVIVILSIILLISVPLVSDVIKNTKDAALESSAKSIKKAAKDSFMNDQLLGKEIDEVIYVFEDGIQRTIPTTASKLEISGEVPKNGYIRVNKENVILEIENGESYIRLEDDEIFAVDSAVKINPPITFNCGNDYLDIRDNKTYRTVKIGNQCWFKDYLSYTGNGCLSKNVAVDDTACANSVNTGFAHTIYQWKAVMNGESHEGAQGLCPSGFRIPTDNDYKKLERFIGMPESELDLTGSRGTDQAYKLYMVGDPAVPFALATNETGFTARSHHIHIPPNITVIASFWTYTSSSKNGEVYRRSFNVNSGQISRTISSNITHSQIMRCILK